MHAAQLKMFIQYGAQRAKAMGYDEQLFIKPAIDELTALVDGRTAESEPEPPTDSLFIPPTILHRVRDLYAIVDEYVADTADDQEFMDRIVAGVNKLNDDLLEIADVLTTVATSLHG